MIFDDSPRRSGQRGAAMVEFAILTLVLVPLLTYGFYLMDVGHHMLDLQETVISTTWDYTSRTQQTDPENPKQTSNNFGLVYEANRFEYLDHTSAYDDYGNLNADSSKELYHFEMGSKAAFVKGPDLPGGKADLGRGDVDISAYKSDYAATGGRQVTCALDNNADLEWMSFGLPAGSLNPAVDFGTSKFNRGGVVTCWAKLYVYNYVIPEKFMQDHASVDMTTSVHQDMSTDVEGLGASAKPLVLRDHAALSFDTWAINDGAKTLGGSDADIDYCPQKSNPFYARVTQIYTGGGAASLSTNPINLIYKDVAGQAARFASAASSNDVATILPVPASPVTSMVATDASPEGFSCSIGRGIPESIAGRPANPIGVYLVARHDRSDMANGVLEKSPIGWGDVGANGLGPAYESTPYSNGNPTYGTAWNYRGAYYMGESVDNG